uniref:C-C chemokine receptor type 3 n=1 Tax=Monopterus albus TaxID=43700 RepID=UPI0009B48A74|nr:C-C chemokine receptor type 3-like [Monopterus albus]
MNIVGLFIPVIIMGFCYSQIIWTLLTSQSSKKQAIRLVLVVVIVFVCCWLPYNIASFFKALELLGIYTDCEKSKAIILTLQITEAISYSHSSFNPILYSVGQQQQQDLCGLVREKEIIRDMLLVVLSVSSSEPGHSFTTVCWIDMDSF